HVDLLLAGRGQHDGELRLRLGGGGGSAAGGRGRGDRDRGGRGHAPLLFQQLRKLGRLEDGELRQVVNQLGKVGHWILLGSLGPKKVTETAGLSSPPPGGHARRYPARVHRPELRERPRSWSPVP